MRTDIDKYIKGYKAIPIICGPTASGKSSLALELCRRTGGELISCDSMQIYRGLDVGTAKATREEKQSIPHHMIDIIDPGDNYSVNDYLHDALICVEQILNRGHLPVICGGTGQYISALRDGIRYIGEDVPESLTRALYAEYEANGIVNMYSRLAEVDPEAASKIHPNNTRRVIRALGVYLHTGKTFSKWKNESCLSGPEYPFILFEPDYEECRNVLYDRINERVDQMMSTGLLDEVRYLYSLDVDRKSTCFQAIGYKEFSHYVEVVSSNAPDSSEVKEALARAIYEVKLNSRHYAKRQLTWFRYIDDIIRIDIFSSVDEQIDIILGNILSKVS